MLPVVKGAFISVCRQIYATCEGLQVLLPYGLHESIAKAWKKVCILIPLPTPQVFISVTSITVNTTVDRFFFFLLRQGFSV